jgi:lipopolysaccharide export system protein LptC
MDGGIIMKWMTLILVIVIVFCGSAFGATLNLRATWTANTEQDMKEYRLYRTDGTRTLIGTITHPTTSYNFSVTVADNSSGTLTFVLTAVDTNNNQSSDSTPASYSYNLDTIPPTSPRNLSVQNQ